MSRLKDINLRRRNTTKVFLVAVFSFVAVTAQPFVEHSSAQQVLMGSAISQGYATNELFAVGSLVSRQGETLRKASTENEAQLLGVVTDGNLVELNKGNVQVATVGIINAYVSTISGDIRQGDAIAASPLEGIGMKAEKNGYIIGIAQADFSQAKEVYDTDIKARNGQTDTVSVGLLPVKVQVGYHTLPDVQTSPYPAFLTHLVTNITGKEVPVLRVTLALIILLIGIITIIILIYTSVRFSLISIGRNPLAAKSVHRGLVGSVLFAIGVLLFTLLSLYLVLVL
jgi:hypothetical protein